MFCFNEFAFTVQVKHKINSIQILGFIYIFSHKSQQLFKNLILGYDATASSNTPRSQIRTAVCWVTLSMHTPIPSHMYKHDVIHKSGRTAPWCVPSGWRTTEDGHSKFLSLTVFGILLPCDAVLARYMLWSHVRLSVHLSQAGIVSKQLDESSWFWHGVFLPRIPHSHCVIRKYGYLQKLGYFPLGLRPKLWTLKKFATASRSRCQQHSSSSSSMVELVDDIYTTVDESWLFTTSRSTVTL